MNVVNCQEGKNIHMIHKGSCKNGSNSNDGSSTTTANPSGNGQDPCAGHKCNLMATCRVENNQPKCVCPNICPRLVVKQPICGSDGMNYA